MTRLHTVPNSYTADLYWDGVGRRPTNYLSVQPNGEPYKERTYHTISGMGPNHNLGVHNSSIRTVERALLERYFLCAVDGTFLRPPEISKTAYKSKFLNEFRDCIVAYVKPDATVLTTTQVVNCYTGAKWRIYEQARKSLQMTKLTRKDARLQQFPKFGKDDLSKALRLINPRTARCNLVLGKYIKKIEKPVFAGINNAWGARTEHTVIKGLNVIQSAAVIRSKWDLFKDPVAIGLDASKFDMHVLIEALKFEHSVYEGVFDSAELRKILSWQLYNAGTAYCKDGRVDFAVKGTRCSGDLNTSLGNCVIMCGIVFEYVMLKNITAELCNNGDDCVVIMERSDLENFSDGFKEFFLSKGFRMTWEEPVYEFEQIEFCQSHPVYNGKDWVMVRNPVTCMKKDPMCLQPISGTKCFEKWVGAIGECGMSTVPGIPVMNSFYGAFKRAGRKSTKRYKAHIFKNTSMQERRACVDTHVTVEARNSFYIATGIAPDLQIELERYYDLLQLQLDITRDDSTETHEHQTLAMFDWLLEIRAP